MRIKATATGLQIDEPMVIARINEGKWTPQRPLSEAEALYGKLVDLDLLKTTGYQRVEANGSVIEFRFV